MPGVTLVKNWNWYGVIVKDRSIPPGYKDHFPEQLDCAFTKHFINWDNGDIYVLGESVAGIEVRDRALTDPTDCLGLGKIVSTSALIPQSVGCVGKSKSTGESFNDIVGITNTSVVENISYFTREYDNDSGVLLKCEYFPYEYSAETSTGSSTAKTYDLYDGPYYYNYHYKSEVTGSSTRHYYKTGFRLYKVEHGTTPLPSLGSSKIKVACSSNSVTCTTPPDAVSCTIKVQVREWKYDTITSTWSQNGTDHNFNLSGDGTDYSEFVTRANTTGLTYQTEYPEPRYNQVWSGSVNFWRYPTWVWVADFGIEMDIGSVILKYEPSIANGGVKPTISWDHIYNEDGTIKTNNTKMILAVGFDEIGQEEHRIQVYVKAHKTDCGEV